MDGDEVVDPVFPDDSLLTDDQRVTLTGQLSRLNGNLERQFGIIEQQRVNELRTARRRWWTTIVLVLALAGIIARVETVRSDQRDRDREQAAAQSLKDERARAEEDRLACQRTNVARRELRQAIDNVFAAVKAVAPPEVLATATKLADDVHAQLAEGLPSRDCGGGTSSTVYASCAEARAAGAAPMVQGEPGYSTDLDANADGVACE